MFLHFTCTFIRVSDLKLLVPILECDDTVLYICDHRWVVQAWEWHEDGMVRERNQ